MTEVRDEFWALLARLPETESEFEAQRATLRQWRADPRFEAYWKTIDSLLDTDFEHVRTMAALSAQFPLEDYDYDALRVMDEADMEETRRQWQ